MDPSSSLKDSATQIVMLRDISHRVATRFQVIRQLLLLLCKNQADHS